LFWGIAGSTKDQRIGYVQIEFENKVLVLTGEADFSAAGEGALAKVPKRGMNI
jgi:hypothetical protein